MRERKREKERGEHKRNNVLRNIRKREDTQRLPPRCYWQEGRKVLISVEGCDPYAGREEGKEGRSVEKKAVIKSIKGDSVKEGKSW